MKLDLGCGPNKKEGFVGVDRLPFDGKVDLVMDLVELLPGVPAWTPFDRAKDDGKASFKPWPWEDASVDEVHTSHFVEHLTSYERIHFFNELYRVLKPEASCMIVTPHWASGRAYGDPTHQYPAVTEMFYYYVNKEWRDVNAPHVPLTCDFNATWGYSLGHPWNLRNPETQTFALTHYREVAQDLICTVKKK